MVGHIHATGSRNPDREPYTLHFVNEETTAVFGLMNSDVYTDFPKLKILVSHGGGAIPYQLGRFEAQSARGKRGLFSKRLRNLYFDTVLYTEAALKLLIQALGPDRCLFGAECPGVGAARNADTGRTYDDIVPIIKSFDWLTDAEKKAILEDNARKVFRLDI